VKLIFYKANIKSGGEASHFFIRLSFFLSSTSKAE